MTSRLLLLVGALLAPALLTGCDLLGGQGSQTTTNADRTVAERQVDEPTQPVAGAATGLVRKPQWRKVAKFRGEAPMKSAPFKIEANEWQIDWKVKPGKGEFILILHEKDDKFQEVITMTQEAEEMMEYFETPGEYYLQVQSDLPYEIKIEEYR